MRAWWCDGKLRVQPRASLFWRLFFLSVFLLLIIYRVPDRLDNEIMVVNDIADILGGGSSLAVNLSTITDAPSCWKM